MQVARPQHKTSQMKRSVNTMLKGSGWTQNPKVRRVGVHPPVFRLPFLQHFDQYSHNPCTQLGWRLLPFHPLCLMLRANHHVMDRSSTFPLGSASRATLTVTESWTSMIIPIHRSTPGPSPHQWPHSSSRTFEAMNHTCLIARLHRRDCNVQMSPCKTSVYRVNLSL